MSTKFFPISKPSITELEERYVTDAVRSGWVSSIGEYVNRFENGFADYCGVSHAVTVSNGTAAIHLALMALDIGIGDEVIIPDLSFIATANAVIMAGARPVFCDVESETLCIDPKCIEVLITPKTKAIMPVHLYGHPSDMKTIMAIAEKHQLYVIEDAAEAHGASIDSKRVGGFGDCATFSFYGNKNMTTGEGGMITSNNKDLIDRCSVLRDHAMSATKRYWHNELGFNYRLTNLQSALGCAQLERAAELLDARKSIFELYQECLGSVSGLSINRTKTGMTNSYWMICLEIEGLNEASRDILMFKLKSRGIDTRPYFYPMSSMPHLEIYTLSDTPVTKKISDKGLNLPTYIGLKKADIDYICQQVLLSIQELHLNA